MRYVATLALAIVLSLPGKIITTALALGGLSACSTPAQRQAIRQNTRINNRTEDRYNKRRGN